MFFITAKQKPLPQLLVMVLWLFPIMFFLWHGWVNRIAVVLAIIAIILLGRQAKQNNSGLDQSSLWVIIALSSMFLAVLISSALRGQLLFPMLDGPWH